MKPFERGRTKGAFGRQSGRDSGREAGPAIERRVFLRRGRDLALVAFLGGAMGAGCRDSRRESERSVDLGANPDLGLRPRAESKLLRFAGISPHSDFLATVPSGYEIQVLAPWGSPLSASGPAWRDDGTNSGEDQAAQVGDNHDGMHFFPIDGVSSSEGLLVVNHEYVNYEYLFGAEFMSPWNEDKVRKAQHAHGVSVLHIRKGEAGDWGVVLDSRYNRRITARTPMRLTGPAAGHALLQTRADPSGSEVLGTLNNCANGYTPWSTYLTCEENFHHYFGAKGGADDSERPGFELRRRYGIEKRSIGYRWEEFDSRFDFGLEPNESNRFGWVVEIDPFDPTSTPKKRTALGRFKHENAALTLAADGRVVVYMGDDERFEHIYKFVSEEPFVEGNAAANRELLARGQLFAAHFGDGNTRGDGKGVGEWRLLDKAANPTLAADARFASQAEVLINARAAADAVGATRMDRPEWVAVHPKTGEAYCTLTNNDARTEAEIGDANPRASNVYGQIIRWREAGGDAAAVTFEWDLFVVAGNPRAYPDRSDPRAGSSNVTSENCFNSPDGLAVDPAGRLWILTDGSCSDDGAFDGQGNNQMLCADPETGEIRRFLVGPGGCEITGVTWTPDLTTLFVNVQHPGDARRHPAAPGLPFGIGLEYYLSRNPTSFTEWPKNQFPDTVGGGRPRSATLVISRSDGSSI